MKYEFLDLTCWVFFMSLLAGIAWKDFRERRIPNQLLLCLLLLRFFSIVVNGGKEEGGFAFCGFLVGGFLFLLPYLVGKGSLGAGDVKLFAVVGSFLGVQRIVWTMALTLVLAAICSLFLLLGKRITRKTVLPLGPFVWLAVLLLLAKK